MSTIKEAMQTWVILFPSQLWRLCRFFAQLFTITEYMQNGSLSDVLHKNSSKSGSYGWYQNGRFIALGVARGLAYLHSQSVSYESPTIAD